MREELTKYSMLAVLVILLYFSYLVLEPFLTYLFFSIILVIVFKPAYEWIVKKIGHPRTSSLLLVIALILVLIIPSFFVGYSLVREAPAFYATAVENIDLTTLDAAIQERTGIYIGAEESLSDTVPRFKNYIINNVGSVLSGATTLFIGLFIMFFTMYFLFAEGDELFTELKRVIPLAQKHQKKLFTHINNVVHAIINGQVILGVVQGVLGAITLLLLGVPYAILWGFIMIITSMIPVLGSFVVWIPIAVWLFITGAVTKAIILVIIGTVLISQIDNFLRPYVVSRRADIHPVVVIVGVFGGLVAFGPAGFVTGPLVLALLVTVLRFYAEEVRA